MSNVVVNDDTVFYYGGLKSYGNINSAIMDKYDTLSYDAKFELNISTKYKRNTYISRDGVYKNVFKDRVFPEMELPTYDENFSETFEQVTDERARDFIPWLRESDNNKLAMFWSGGIDSTVALASIIRNIPGELRPQVYVTLSGHSLIENNYFYDKCIKNQFTCIDTRAVKVEELISYGFRVITSDTGDGIFGTELGTQFYYEYGNLLRNASSTVKQQWADLFEKVASDEVHYTKFQDLIIDYFQHPKDPNFGKIYYEKLVKNVETCSVPIYSLHDFFWWIIFNVKHTHCAIRLLQFYTDVTVQDKRKMIQEDVVNWYQSDKYSLWSMANNNNGQKIKGITGRTYKWCAREYINTVSQDEWYFDHKLKLASLNNVISNWDSKNWNKPFYRDRFGINSDYQVIYQDTPGLMEYLFDNLQSFKIDWT